MTPVSVGALRKLMKELRAAGKDRKPVALGGAGEIARTLERELTRGGDSSAVRVGAPPGAAVWIAAVVAARLGEAGAPLAGRLPVLRGAVCDRIVASFARKNGIVGAAVFVPGADLPILALNQVRMLLLLDQAYGLELDPRERLPEILAVVGAGLGLRTVARELLDVVPVAGWAVKGGIAYAGTRALGEAAIRRLQLVH
jgi:uncharacterized protein (DUF697 family)